jgi:hypothetical protein
MFFEFTPRQYRAGSFRVTIAKVPILLYWTDEILPERLLP